MEREIHAIGDKAPEVVSSEPLSSEDVEPGELAAAASVKDDDLPVFDAAAKALADLQDIYGSGLGDSEIRLLDADSSSKVFLFCTYWLSKLLVTFLFCL